MTLDQLRALDFATVWARLFGRTPSRDRVAAIAEQFAGLVAADDGTDTTPADAATEVWTEAHQMVTGR